MRESCQTYGLKRIHVIGPRPCSQSHLLYLLVLTDWTLIYCLLCPAWFTLTDGKPQISIGKPEQKEGIPERRSTLPRGGSSQTLIQLD